MIGWTPKTDARFKRAADTGIGMRKISLPPHSLPPLYIDISYALLTLLLHHGDLGISADDTHWRLDRSFRRKS